MPTIITSPALPPGVQTANDVLSEEREAMSEAQRGYTGGECDALPLAVQQFTCCLECQREHLSDRHFKSFNQSSCMSCFCHQADETFH